MDAPNQVRDLAAGAKVLEDAVTSSGQRLLDLSAASPVLLVFSRHAGCTFCREGLAELARHRAAIESSGVRIVVVHMGGMDPLFAKFGLTGIERILDSTRQLYGTFGLKRGSWRQLFGWTVLKRGFFGGALMRYGIGRVQGDSTQMPGWFLIQRGAIVRRFRHRSVADRPDYGVLCTRLTTD